MTHHWRDGQASGYDWIERSTRLAIYLRDGNKCLRCETTEDLSLDHFDPSNRSNAPTNLVTLCQTCNSSRRASDPDEWDAVFAVAARAAILLPVDRKEGLRLAKARWPQRYAAKAARCARRRERMKKQREDA